MKINISAKSDVGIERTNNEDAFILCPVLGHQNWREDTNGYIYNGNLGSLAVVADGMGGANAGETASNIALETVKNCFELHCIESIDLSDKNICSFLEAVIKAANDAIMKRIEYDPETIGMGTTIVLLWLIKQKAYIAWCGDSRCYVFNPRTGLKSLTKDHSYVQELIDRGEISIKESYSHPDNNVITRCLGDSDSSVTPDIIIYDVRPNDTFLLCSDGLCGYCKDRNIEKVLYSNISDIDECCKCLINIALSAGGFDNITVTLLSVVDDNASQISIPILYRLKNMFNL